jgi:hypothetical protein
MMALRPMPNWKGRTTHLVALGLVAAGASVVVLRGCARASDINQTRAAALEIQTAAIRWQVFYGDAVCPTIRQMIAGRTVASSTRMVDAWDQPFVITCSELTIGVTSFGPDRKRGTADDIVVLPAPVRKQAW